jgi:endoglucanase
MQQSRWIGHIAGLVASLALVPGAFAAEQVSNGGFDDGIAPWWATGNLSPEIVEGRLCADIPGGLSNPWDAIIGYNGVALVEGESYRFSFAASGTPPAAVRAVVQMPMDPYTAYLSLTPAIGEEMTTHDDGFSAPEGRDDGQIVFQLGGAAEGWRFCLDDVSLEGGVAVEAYAADTGPGIRVNQLGYLPDGPKKATIVSDASDPVEFTVADSAGEVVFSGMTQPHGLDETAGESVHAADFSSLEASGDGFTLRAAGEESYPFAIKPALYKPLQIDALSYFYLARSGIDIDAAIVGDAYARAAGHVSKPGDSAPNKGDFEVPCQPTEVSEAVYGEPWTCDYTLSPVGGWYDAGDHGKYVVNGGISVAQLMAAFEWAKMLGEDAAEAIGDGTLPLPEHGNGVPDILDEARWELEFIEKMIVPEGEDLAGMVHHKIHDNQWTGLPLMPDKSDKVRELHRPSTTATLNAAAVFAQAARVFEPYDADYAAHVLELAKRTWQAAGDNPVLLATPEDGRSGGGPYDDTNVEDERLWAAAELFLTTGEEVYLNALTGSDLFGGDVYQAKGFDWRDVGAYATIQLAMNADRIGAEHAETLRRSILNQADALIALQQENPFGHAYVPADGVYDWGSSHLVVQNGLILAAAHELSGEEKYRSAAIESADYVLGRNALNLSYITGYGTVYAKNQHSRWFANQVAPDLPNPPKGSLSGGPNSSIQDPVAQRLFAAQGCPAQKCYIDDIESWSTNEITINWNAALAHFASWLAEQ